MSRAWLEILRFVHRVVGEDADEFSKVIDAYPSSMESPRSSLIRLVAARTGVIRVGVSANHPKLALLQEGLKHLPMSDPSLGIDEIEVEVISPVTFQALQERYNHAQLNGRPALSAAQPLQDWLMNNCRPAILYIRVQEAIDALPTIKAEMDRHIAFNRGSTVIVVDARTIADLIRAQAHADEGSHILILTGLDELSPIAELSSSWWELDAPKLLLRRAALASPTIILGKSLPPWEESDSGFADVLRVSCRSERWLKDGEDTTQSASTDDEELIRVAAAIVAAHFDASPAALLERRSDQSSLRARQAAVYVLREWKSWPFSLLGRVLGDRAYVSTAQAYRRIADRLDSDPDLKRRVEASLDSLRRSEMMEEH